LALSFLSLSQPPPLRQSVLIVRPLTHVLLCPPALFTIAPKQGSTLGTHSGVSFKPPNCLFSHFFTSFLAAAIPFHPPVSSIFFFPFLAVISSSAFSAVSCVSERKYFQLVLTVDTLSLPPSVVFFLWSFFFFPFFSVFPFSILRYSAHHCRYPTFNWKNSASIYHLSASASHNTRIFTAAQWSRWDNLFFRSCVYELLLRFPLQRRRQAPIRTSPTLLPAG